jgi:hypothetical protein
MEDYAWLTAPSAMSRNVEKWLSVCGMEGNDHV